MSYSIAREKREEYLAKYGHEYNGADYPLASAILDADLRQLVASLKVADANVRQSDIHHEMQKYRKGDVAVLPDDKKHLVSDQEEAVRNIQLWSPYCR